MPSIVNVLRCFFHVLCLWIFSLCPVKADLQQEMDAMFGTMTNVTTPTAHLGQRRGVITGGSVFSRNRIMDVNAVSLIPPSFSAGCGGIDLFGGSFSFINLNQFVDLLRAVAANAGGYAFQLAINAMCPDCGNIMTDLQKKVQQLNQLFSNSCQMAQGLVNDATSILPMEVQSNMRKSQASFTTGVTDVFGALTNTSSQGDPTQQVKNNVPAQMTQKIQGNLVWRALNHANASNWYKFGGDELLEAAMSVTGTVIVKAPQEAPDGKGESNPVTVLPSILTMKDILNGTGETDYQKVKVYDCDTNEADGCLNPAQKDLSLIGLKQRVSAMLIGSDSQSGLLYKFATNTGVLSAEEIAFMDLVPDAVSALIRNLAREDYGMALLFANESAPVIALEMAQLMVQGMVDSVRQAGAIGEHAYMSKLADRLAQANQDLQAESAELSGRYGNPETLMQFYVNFMLASRSKEYSLVNTLPNTAQNYPSK